MATLSGETYVKKDGTKSTMYVVKFFDPAGQRRKVHLGKVPKRIAETAKIRIEALVAAKLAGHSIDTESAGWLAAIDDSIHEKLSNVELVEARQKADDVRPETVTLGEHLERYFVSLGQQKRMTGLNYARARRLLEEFFGKDRKLSTIHGGDADDYKTWLLSPTKNRKAFAPASASVDLRRARQFFKAAVRRKLIADNPFDDVKCGSQANASRMHFVTQETIEAVIAACPDNDWRLIFAFARYAGLRIPSELEELRWSDVNWERNRITIHEPKVEHHAGRGVRVVPIFPELRPHLERAFHEAPAGSEYVVPRARGGRNLRRYAEQTIKKAGVPLWPKLFVNCRSSRETELLAVHPAHVVQKWIGHTAKVAQQHYLQVTDADFDRAAGIFGTIFGTVRGGHEPSPADAPSESPLILRESREASIYLVPPAGIEPATYGLGNHRSIH
jgi:integrase